MVLIIIGIAMLILFFIFRKVISLIFRVLFYIGIVLIVCCGISLVSNSSITQKSVNTIKNGTSTVINNNITRGITNDIKSATENMVMLAKNKIEDSISGILDGTLGIENNKKITLEEYRNSSMYKQQIFKNGDEFVYVNGMFCEKGSASKDYNIYEVNINGYNYKPINYKSNDFAGFEIGSSSITIDGVTYYKGLEYNEINVYGVSYGTNKDQLQSIKSFKIHYKKDAEYVYINDSEYKLGNGENSINIDGKSYELINGSSINLANYLNINGFIYWKSEKSNGSSIDINGVNYISSNNSWLDNLI